MKLLLFLPAVALVGWGRIIADLITDPLVGAATFGALAITIIGMFATGQLVPGKFLDRSLVMQENLRLSVDELRKSVDALVSSQTRKNDLDEQRLAIEGSRSKDRRSGPRDG